MCLSWSVKTQSLILRGPHTAVSVTSRSPTRFSRKNGKKTLWSRQEGNVAILKAAQNILFLTRPALKRNEDGSACPNWLGSEQSPTVLDKGRYPASPLLCPPLSTVTSRAPWWKRSTSKNCPSYASFKKKSLGKPKDNRAHGNEGTYGYSTIGRD